MKSVVLATLLLANVANAEQACQTIRGRVHFYPANGQTMLWHVGTHHFFWIKEEASQAKIFRFTPSYEKYKEQPVALFAEFDVCPTEPYVAGAAQPAKIRSVRHPVVTPVR